MSPVISADEIKKSLPNYTPDKAEQFHHESAVMADKSFDIAIKESPVDEVILLCGGTASGKTEFLATQLADKECVILDATLSTEIGAKIKLSKIIKLRKKPIIYAVVPDDLKRAFVAFLSRDRKFSEQHFYSTHSGCRKTLLWIATNHPEIEVNIVESSYMNDKLEFAKIVLEDNKQLVEYLSSLQLSENDIISLIKAEL